MHQTRTHQPCQPMEKAPIVKQCSPPGERYPNLVDREGRQHFQDQQKIGNIRKLIKKREGGKLISVTTKVLYGNAEEVKNKLGCHTAYVERTSLLITNDE